MEGVSLLAFHSHTWTLTWKGQEQHGGAEDGPEIPLVGHIVRQSPASLGVLNSMALILSNLWLAVYSRHDLIPQKNIPPPKTHIFLFIFTSSRLFGLHYPYYVAQPHTHSSLHEGLSEERTSERTGKTCAPPPLCLKLTS